MASGIGYIASVMYADQLTNQLRHRGTNTDCIGARGLQNDETVYDIPWVKNGKPSDLPFPVRTPVRGKGYVHDDTGSEWWEKVHLLPRFIDFGQILTTQSIDMELFNAFRLEDKQLNSIDNNVGEGLNVLNVPTLPHTILHLDGLVLTIEATTDGVPNFDSTIDFNLNIYTLLLPVEGNRVIVFPYAPESPMIETLGFLTDVITAKDGSEQRICLRKGPRQEYDMRLIREEQFEKNQIEFLLFDWQARAFGIPVWYEPTKLTAAASIGAVTVSVESTAYADYREGGLAIVMQDEQTFDSLEIDTIGPTSLTFTSGLQHAYEAGTKVYPIKPCMAQKVIQGQRYRTGAAEYTMRMRVMDNDVDLSSAAAFSSFGGKVLLDDDNFTPDGTLPLAFEREIVEFDGTTGKFSHTTPWSKSKRVSQKAWAISGSRQKLWEVRQLLYHLKGKQVSFYLPTFQHEFTVVSDLLQGVASMNVRNSGYTRLVKARSTWNIIKISLVDGSTLTRTILSSSETSETVEALAVDAQWASLIPVANIAKVECYELVRFDTDEFRIEHLSGVGDATIIAPVKSVFD